MHWGLAVPSAVHAMLTTTGSVEHLPLMLVKEGLGVFVRRMAVRRRQFFFSVTKAQHTASSKCLHSNVSY